MHPKNLCIAVCSTLFIIYLLKNVSFGGSPTPAPAASLQDTQKALLRSSLITTKSPEKQQQSPQQQSPLQAAQPSSGQSSASASASSPVSDDKLKCKQADAKFLANHTAARPRIAISSFPRSGISLVRFLLERATGVWTGSFTEDRALLKAGFKGEGYDDQSVSAAKNFLITAIKRDGAKYNELDINKFRIYDKIIYLVRNPFEIFLSYYNNGTRNQTGVSTKEMRKERLRNEVARLVPMWKEHVRFVVQRLDSQSRLNLNGVMQRVLLVRYEDLLTSRPLPECVQVEHAYQKMSFCTLHEYELYRMISFLELPYSVVAAGNNKNKPGIQTEGSRSKSEPILIAKRKAKNRKVSKDFRRVSVPLSEARIKCAFGDQMLKQDAVRKHYQDAYEAVPSDLRTWFLNETHEELCYLGYTHLFRDVHRQDAISCDGFEISPHLMYSKIA